MKLRKLVMGVAAVALPLGVMTTVVGIGAAGAKATNQPGTLDCALITGTVTFTPKLTNTPTTVKTVTKTKLTNCTPSTGLKPKSGASSSTTTTANDDCAMLAAGSTTPFTLTTKWAPATKIKPTKSTVSGISPATNGAGDAGFQLPNEPGGTSSGTGSYLGSDGGTTGSAQAFTSETSTQIGATCTTTGLASLTITSGSAHFG